MPKVIRLGKSSSVHNMLLELLEMADKGEIDNVMIACNHASGEVHTGWHNLDYGQRQVLVAHQQMDLVQAMIDENY